MAKKNNVVDFGEGILGIGHASKEVAQCLKKEANNQDTETSLKMQIVASDLERGLRIDIQRLRDIGEKPLHATERMFLSL